MKHINSKKIYLYILIAFLFFISLGLTYAYFILNVSGNIEANSQTVTTGSLSIFYQDGPQIKMTEIIPGAKSSKVFTVTNNGTLDTSYEINWINYYNEILNNELTTYWQCKSYINYGEENQEESGSCTSVSSNPLDSQNEDLAVGISLPIDITHEYTFTIEFIETNEQQNYNQGKTFYGTLNIVESSSLCNSDINVVNFGIPVGEIDENSSYSAHICIKRNSDVDLSKSKYVISRYFTPLGTTSNVWNNAEQFQTSSKSIYNSDLEAGLFYIHVLTEDINGNKTETISSTIDISINQETRTQDLDEYAEELALTAEPVYASNKVKIDFIQPWIYTNTSYSNILKNFRALKRAEYEAVIFNYASSFYVESNTVHIDTLFYESDIDNVVLNHDFSNNNKIADYFFQAANEVGLDVYIGTPIASDWYDINNIQSQSWINTVNDYTIAVVDELYEKYGSNAAYKGWYYSNEMYTNNSNYESDWINIVSDVVDHINTLPNRGNIIFSPFLSPYLHADLNTIETNWTNFIETINFRDNDIFSMQDGYGTSKYSVDYISDILNTIRNVVKSRDDVDIKFYTNVENFTTTNEDVNFDRVKSQIQIARYISDGLLSFSYTHYFSPFSDLNTKTDEYYYDKLYRTFIGQSPLDESIITMSAIPEGGSVFVDNYGEEVPLPAGFSVSSNTNERTVRNGLVIKDAYDNEFVWIPIKYGVQQDGYEYDESNYDGAAYFKQYYPGNNHNDLILDTLPNGVTSDTHQINKYYVNF